MDDKKIKTETKKHEYFLESVRRRFDFVANSINSLDTKTGTLFVVEVAVAIGYSPIFIQNLTTWRSDFDAFNIFISILLATGFIFLVISICLLVKAAYPKKHAMPPIKEEHLQKTEVDMLRQIIVNTEDATKDNRCILSEKVMRYRRAVWSLILASILLSVSMLLYAFLGSPHEIELNQPTNITCDNMEYLKTQNHKSTLDNSSKSIYTNPCNNKK